MAVDGSRSTFLAAAVWDIAPWYVCAAGESARACVCCVVSYDVDLDFFPCVLFLLSRRVSGTHQAQCCQPLPWIGMKMSPPVLQPLSCKYPKRWPPPQVRRGAFVRVCACVCVFPTSSNHVLGLDWTEQTPGMPAWVQAAVATALAQALHELPAPASSASPLAPVVQRIAAWAERCSKAGPLRGTSDVTRGSLLEAFVVCDAPPS